MDNEPEDGTIELQLPMFRRGRFRVKYRYSLNVFFDEYD